jgi:hypothetical protein
VLQASIPGAGKSLYGVLMVRATMKKRALIIGPRNVEDVWRMTFGNFDIPMRRISSVSGENHEYHAMREFMDGAEGVFFTNWETAIRLDYAKFKPDVLVADECFVAGTKISTPHGDRLIETLRPGDTVYGFDHSTGEVVSSVVRANMVRQTRQLLGNSTPNHPYYVVGDGYRPCADLTSEDQLYALSETSGIPPTVRCVPVRHSSSNTVISTQNLLARVFERIQKSANARAKSRPQLQATSSSQGTHDKSQSRDSSRSSSQGATNKTGPWPNLRMVKWWKRYRALTSRKGNERSSRLATCGSGDRERRTSTGIPAALQNRRGLTRIKNWSRVRWAITYNSGTQASRPKENRMAGKPRLGHLEILEPRNLERYQKMCEKGTQSDQVTVYNLETESSNYFAAGLLVHNCHRASSHDAAHRAGSNAHMLYTIGRGVANRGGWRIGLSGTPFGNKPEGAWAVMRALWPDHPDSKSFWRWSKKHLTIEDKIIVANGRRQEVKVLGDELNPGSIVKSLPLYLRHEENQPCCKYHPRGVQADLPARIPHMVGVDLSPTQRTIYDQLEADMFAWIKDNDYPLSSEGWPMVNMIRMHQVCLAVPSTELAKRLKTDERTGEKVEQDYIAVKYPLGATSSKIDALCDIVADIPPDESIMVYTHSAGIIPVVVERLNKALRAPNNHGHHGEVGSAPLVCGWHGLVSARDRAAIKSDFLAARTRIIVAQVASIGEGTDGLQHICHNEIWLSPSSSGLINQQAIKRLHRPGQKHPINTWMIYARDTLEVEQMQKLAVNADKMKAGLRAKKGKKRDGRG